MVYGGPHQYHAQCGSAVRQCATAVRPSRRTRGRARHAASEPQLQVTSASATYPSQAARSAAPLIELIAVHAVPVTPNVLSVVSVAA